MPEMFPGSSTWHSVPFTYPLSEVSIGFHTRRSSAVPSKSSEKVQTQLPPPGLARTELQASS